MRSATIKQFADFKMMQLYPAIIFKKKWCGVRIAYIAKNGSVAILLLVCGLVVN